MNSFYKSCDSEKRMLGACTPTVYEQLVFLPYIEVYRKLIIGAISLDVFSNLESPLTAEELADKMGWDPGNTLHLLQGLHCIGFVDMEGNNYVNTPDTSHYLVQGKPYYMGDMLLFSCCNKETALDNIAEQVKNGPLTTQQLPKSLDFTSGGEMAWRSQMGIRRQEIIDLVRALPENKSILRLLDLGCGGGIFGMSLVQDMPGRTAVLFDRPAMEPAITENIKRFGLQDKVSVMSGDFLHDDIGGEYDFILCSWIMFSAIEGGRNFFAKLKAALNPCGVVLCLNEGILPDFSAPWDMALWFLTYHFQDIPLGVISGSVKDAAMAAGFSSVENRTMLLSSGTHDINILR